MHAHIELIVAIYYWHGSGAVKVCSYKFAEGLALLLGLFCCERDDIYIYIYTLWGNGGRGGHELDVSIDKGEDFLSQSLFLRL